MAANRKLKDYNLKDENEYPKSSFKEAVKPLLSKMKTPNSIHDSNIKK